eukprot:NODE_2359_length_1441_cov_72.782246_g2242_i0.p1 GENE.NODE_2359_length_1441_cov_72.782246_g2242_i0~~NODE_2359_length_1441_cov_72.782246_g2242_i0.p1  ORF type:complete len:450 (+),score=39.10 NODE_2359_length_1441_cov_72.782246_g2242_i0:35-1384(+)
MLGSLAMWMFHNKWILVGLGVPLILITCVVLLGGISSEDPSAHAHALAVPPNGIGREGVVLDLTPVADTTAAVAADLDDGTSDEWFAVRLPALGPTMDCPSTVSGPSDCSLSGGCCCMLRRRLEQLNCSCESRECTCRRSGDIAFPTSVRTIAQYWESPSFPIADYIHARVFASIADSDCATFLPSRLHPYSIMWCDPRHLARLVNHISRIVTPFILVTHLRDVHIRADLPGASVLLKSPMLLRWYAINVEMSHPKLVHIPLGVNIRAAGQLYNASLYKAKIAPEGRAYCLFGIGANQRCRPNSPRSACARRKVWAALQQTGVMQMSESVLRHMKAKADIKIPRPEYLERQLETKFIISPPGNGIDTFRTWESVYLGRVPVVVNTNISVLYQQLPILVFPTWEDVTPEALDGQWDSLLRTEFDYSRMSALWWMQQLLQECRRPLNGSYT